MSNTKPLVGGKVYDTLKWTVQIALPAFATMYFALSEIWGFPNAAEVVGTITAITTFLGILLGVSTYHYKQTGAKYDGTMLVTENDGAENYNLELDEDPSVIPEMNELVFKVEDFVPRQK